MKVVVNEDDEMPSVQLNETNAYNENKLEQKNTPVKNEPEELLVFGVVSSNNSPNSSLSKSDLKSL